MEVIKVKEADGDYFVFIDKKYRIVEHPSRFLLSIYNRSLRYSDASINLHSKILRYFTEYLEKRFKSDVDISIATIDGIVISEYLKALKEQGLAANTIRNREAVIKEFLMWLTTEEGNNVRNNNGYATEKYKSPNPSIKIPKYLTIEEIIDFMNLMHDESQRCLMHFLFDSGLRASKVVRLKKNDLPDIQDFSDDTMYFDIDVQGSKGRGGMIKQRKTFISRAMLLRINRLHKQHPLYRKSKRTYGQDMPCFLNVKGGLLTSNSIKNLMYKTALRGGLDTTKYSAHKLRHSFSD